MKGQRLESFRGSGREKTRLKVDLTLKATRKRSALAATKISSANRSRGKVSKPKSTNGGVLFGTATRQTISTILAASSQRDRRGLTAWFCRTVQPDEFLWKCHNIKVDLTATRQSVHTVSVCSMHEPDTGVILFMHTVTYTIILIYYKLSFCICNHKSCQRISEGKQIF